METRRALVLAPPDPTSGVKILLDKMAALLEMINSFNAITPSKSLSQDLGFLYINPFLSNNMLSHFQHNHWVLVWIRWIKVIWRRLLELCYSLLPPHFFSPLSLFSVLCFALVKWNGLPCLALLLSLGFGPCCWAWVAS